MFRYIIRLDDACPTTNGQMWDKVLDILGKYYIKPIIGVIPDCSDTSTDFNNSEDIHFWDKVLIWQNKGYAIALHGLHELNDIKNVKAGGIFSALAKRVHKDRCIFDC